MDIGSIINGRIYAHIENVITERMVMNAVDEAMEGKNLEEAITEAISDKIDDVVDAYLGDIVSEYIENNI